MNFILFISIPIILLILVITSHIFTLKYNISDDRIFIPFHFSSGILISIWLSNLYITSLIAVIVTIFIGIIWEVYEYLSWKLVFKKKKFKPKLWDTRNDLILDFLGALIGVGLFQFI